MYKFKKAFTLAEGAMHVAMESFMHRRLCINEISTKIGSILPRPTEDSKAGFTLAEVLITLGIIGVVAAITIPGLLTRSEQNVTVTKLERAISVLNQAYKLSFEEFGEPGDEAFTMGGEEYFKTYWAPYIKVLTYCKTPEACGYKSNSPFKLVNGKLDGTALVWNEMRTTFYTADGFLYIIFIGGNNNGTFTANNTVLVDINGGQGPNRWGRDLFWLVRLPDGTGIQPKCYEMSKSEVTRQCKSGSQAACCAAKIRNDGWKIEKDYPWK